MLYMPDYTIKSIDDLYRRVPKKNPNCWKDINGKKVPSSFAFKTKPDEDGLSVNIAVLSSFQETVIFSDLIGVAKFPASIPIEEGYECRQDKKTDNPAHALIVGDTRPIAKKLAGASVEIFE